MTTAIDSPFDPDGLAGIVDLFGALTPAELEQALSELAFKRGTDLDESAVATAIDEAVRSYALVRYATGAADSENGAGGTADDDAPGDQTLLAPGPAAFPTLPPNAEDLPRILDVDPRDVNRDTAAEALAERFRADAARAVSAGDGAEIRRLLDLTYDVAVWAESIDVDDVRDRLDAALEDGA
ncbi:MAG: hypothetical protein ABEI27_11075 [Halobellus sp.]|uniref:DUF7109 family protein n=1 Tax=Halobellus sp. TaxID=1979212 RepID=UPI0035D4C29F